MMFGIGWLELSITIALVIALYGGARIRGMIGKARWLLNQWNGEPDHAREIEYQFGRELALSLTNKMPIDSDSAGREFVAAVGKRLAAGCDLRFTFEVVQTRGANAFALPGGFVFVTRPLLELCADNDEEMAFILGHEMGHVLLGHSRDSVLASRFVSVLAGITLSRGVLAALLRHPVERALISGYSRTQEFEADEYAVRLTKQADFDPAGGVNLLTRLQNALGTESDQEQDYFSTHPTFADRVANVRRAMSE